MNRLKSEGFWVRGVDIKSPEFAHSQADEFILGDLRDQAVTKGVCDRPFDEVYQLAADMGGAGYIFSGEQDADIVLNSGLINLNLINTARLTGHARIFFASSACIYPAENQTDPENPICTENSAYPANPDSEYGWEKLFSERLYLSFNQQYGTQFKVGRFHNVFGPHSAWQGGREKAPAAICRKVAEADNAGTIEIWGDGQQTRSFLYVDEAVEAMLRLLRSDFSGPVNIGSEEMISINDLARMAISISGKDMTISHIDGPLGVRGRNSDNRLLKQQLGWEPSQPLQAGMERMYHWVADQVTAQRDTAA